METLGLMGVSVGRIRGALTVAFGQRLVIVVLKSSEPREQEENNHKKHSVTERQRQTEREGMRCHSAAAAAQHAARCHFGSEEEDLFQSPLLTETISIKCTVFVRPCCYDRQVTSLSVADQLVLRQTDRPHCRPASPAALVLTVNIAGLLFARLFALVEGKLSGKEVLFTLVIERLLRKRRRGDGVKKRRERGRRLMWVWTE